MFEYSKLRWVLACVSLLFLAACSMGDKTDWPSLAADDQWDRMAAERDKPFPGEEEMPPESDSSDMAVPAAEIDLSLDRAASRQILTEAAEKYSLLSSSLERGFAELAKAGQDKADQERQWRTLQLYLSRLTALQKDIFQAMASIGAGEMLAPADRALVETGQTLAPRISKHIEDTLEHLARMTP